MSRIGIFGGSFNPIHNGHVEVAKMAIQHVDEVWFMPVYNHTNKNKKLIDFYHRMNMIKYVIKNELNMKVKPFEIYNNSGRTIDLLTNITNNLELSHGRTFSLIVGSDCINDIKQWYNWEDLLNQYEMIAIARRGEELHELLHRNIKYLQSNISNVSSTSIRKEINNEDYLKDNLNSEVLDYIKTYNLFKDLQ